MISSAIQSSENKKRLGIGSCDIWLLVSIIPVNKIVIQENHSIIVQSAEDSEKTDSHQCGLIKKVYPPVRTDLQIQIIIGRN